MHGFLLCVLLSLNHCAGETDFLPTGMFFAQRLRELNTTNVASIDAQASETSSENPSVQVQTELRGLREQNAALNKTLDTLMSLLREGKASRPGTIPPNLDRV